MLDYNYYEEMHKDIIAYLEENYKEYYAGLDADELQEKLYDDLFIEDSVTGNGSGSYFFNTYKSEEAIAHNLDILADAIREFGCDADILEKGAEWCDVTIRCYLLGEVLGDALEEFLNNTEE